VLQGLDFKHLFVSDWYRSLQIILIKVRIRGFKTKKKKKLSPYFLAFHRKNKKRTPKRLFKLVRRRILFKRLFRSRSRRYWLKFVYGRRRRLHYRFLKKYFRRRKRFTLFLSKILLRRLFRSRRLVRFSTLRFRFNRFRFSFFRRKLRRKINAKSYYFLKRRKRLYRAPISLLNFLFLLIFFLSPRLTFLTDFLFFSFFFQFCPNYLIKNGKLSWGLRIFYNSLRLLKQRYKISSFLLIFLVGFFIRFPYKLLVFRRGLHFYDSVTFNWINVLINNSFFLMKLHINSLKMRSLFQRYLFFFNEFFLGTSGFLVNYLSDYRKRLKDLRYLTRFKYKFRLVNLYT